MKRPIRKKANRILYFMVLSYLLIIPVICVTIDTIANGFRERNPIVLIVYVIMGLTGLVLSESLSRAYHKLSSQRGHYHFSSSGKMICTWCGTTVYGGFCHKCHEVLDKYEDTQS